MLNDQIWMARALELARRGEGRVEPNPMVGCVLVRGEQEIGSGWHDRFGGPHAEVAALASAKADVAGCTAYVTLEPCCHHGKTPPCSRALIEAGVSRVVVAHRDPFPEVSGGGIAELNEAGLQVDVGLMEHEAAECLAPYLMLTTQHRPWVIAKWAMTLDGKIATHTFDSQWISNPSSRKIVHRLRGRVDGIIVGRGTCQSDDPLLTARPPGPRMATRIVVDRLAQISLHSKLVETASEIPLLLIVGSEAPSERLDQLRAQGVDIAICGATDSGERGRALMSELAGRGMTNVMVEGGGTLLGALHSADLIDEWHVFISPKLVGGADAISPLGGSGKSEIASATHLSSSNMELIDGDLYWHGRTAR